MAGLAAVFMLAVACDRPKVIPADKMVDLYVDMFLADQWLRDHPDEREAADTTLFFDPVLRSRGYEFEDYEASVNHYLRDPEAFSEITERVKNELGARADLRRRLWERKRDLGYRQVDFSADTLWRQDWLLWGAPEEGDSTAVGQDSLDVPDVHEKAPQILVDAPRAMPLKLEIQQ